MIKFNYIKFRNFLNSGNNDTVYYFRPGLTRLEGVSGVGKSTLIDAFYFALTGEPMRDDVKIDELINWVNDNNCRVILSFNRGADEYVVTRTLKDEIENIFKIEKNGTIIPIERKKTYQEQLYNIIGIDKHYIDIGIIKSNLHNTSFLSMKKAARIEFGERFFKLDLVSKIEDLIKNDLDDFKLKLAGCERDVAENTQFRTTLVTKIEQLKKLLEETNQKQIEEKQKRLDEIVAEIDKNNKGKEIIDKIIKTTQEMETELQKIVTEKTGIVSKRGILESELLLKKNKKKLFVENCPECVKVDLIVSDRNLADIEAETKRFETLIEELETKGREIKTKMAGNQPTIAKKGVIESNLRRLTAETAEVSSAIKKLAETAPIIDYAEVEQLSEKLRVLEISREDLTKQTKIYADLKKLMTPLKIFVIRRRIVSMNTKVNQYMQRFQLPFSLIFNEKFEPTIHVGKKKKPFRLLSMGQQRRIELSLMFTFLDLTLELNHENFNLLFLDEVFDNVDPSNVDIIMEIIDERVKASEIEIIFISHNGNFNNHKTDRRVMVTADNGFGKLEDI